MDRQCIFTVRICPNFYSCFSCIGYVHRENISSISLMLCRLFIREKHNPKYYDMLNLVLCKEVHSLEYTKRTKLDDVSFLTNVNFCQLFLKSLISINHYNFVFICTGFENLSFAKQFSLKGSEHHFILAMHRKGYRLLKIT